MELTREQGFPLWLAIGNQRAGLGAGRAGDKERKGITPAAPGHSRDGEPQGAELNRSYSLAQLGRGVWERGTGRGGLHCLDRGTGCSGTETGERMYEAELYRLKGTLTLQSEVRRL